MPVHVTFSSFKLKGKVFSEETSRGSLAINDTVDSENVDLFEDFVTEYGIELEIDERIKDSTNIRRLESNFIKISTFLPQSFVSVLRKVKLNEKIFLGDDFKVVTGIDNQGELIYQKMEETDGIAIGEGGIELTRVNPRITTHEIAHIWEEAVKKEVIENFYNISWKNTLFHHGMCINLEKKILPTLQEAMGWIRIEKILQQW